MTEKLKNVFYGCNQCNQEFAVASEEDIPAGHLCSKKCRDDWAAGAEAREAAMQAEGGR